MTTRKEVDDLMDPATKEMLKAAQAMAKATILGASGAYKDAYFSLLDVAGYLADACNTQTDLLSKLYNELPA